MTSYTIYKHTSPSGKSYIGKTKSTLAARLREHVAMAKFGSTYKFHAALRKYTAEQFTSTVIVSNVPHWAVNAFEKYWINYYNTYKNGYNMTEGGEGRSFISEYQKDCIRTSNSHRTVTEVTREKMRLAAITRGPMSSESYAKASAKKSLPANIYCAITHTLLWENVYLFEFVKAHPEYAKDKLLKTANPKARTKQHKGIYVKWRKNDNNNNK